MGARRGAFGLVWLAMLGACSGSAEPRPATVVYLDTDLLIPQYADRLLIERIDAGGHVLESRSHATPDPTDWPVSFGVLPGSAPVRFRVRLFPEARVAIRRRDESMYLSLPPGTAVPVGYDRTNAIGEVAVGQPLTGFAVDRVFEIEAPRTGVDRVRVMLLGACLGVPGDPVAGRSCIGSGAAGPVFGDARTGVEHLASALEESKAGSWTDALAKSCEGSPRAESGSHDEEICIPGGAFFIGDERLGVKTCEPACATSPERLVRMSPFFLDRYEVSVARFRTAISSGFKPTGKWTTGGACTYTSSGKNDGLPMNCVSWTAASEFCAWDGGRALPSEAQWEFAATGRGQERLYVWGNELPRCDRAAYARVGESLNPAYAGPPSPGTFTECKLSGEGLLAGGSLAGPGQDVSLDGVVDMNANLREWVRDEIEVYERGCWGKPTLTDPVCEVGPLPGRHTLRGGSFGGGSAQLALAWRDAAPADDTSFAYGFRCARRARP